MVKSTQIVTLRMTDSLSMPFPFRQSFLCCMYWHVTISVLPSTVEEKECLFEVGSHSTNEEHVHIEVVTISMSSEH